MVNSRRELHCIYSSQVCSLVTLFVESRKFVNCGRGSRCNDFINYCPAIRYFAVGSRRADTNIRQRLDLTAYYAGVLQLNASHTDSTVAVNVYALSAVEPSKQRHVCDLTGNFLTN